MNVLIVSILAPLITSIQQFPQLYKIYKTHSVKDLSIYSLFLIWIANIMWLLHGYYIYDYSLMISGTISLIINTCIILLYLFYSI